MVNPNEYIAPVPYPNQFTSQGYEIPKKIIHSPVDPLLRIPDEAVDSQAMVERGVLRYNQFSLDRIEWMRRREQYYLGWDDFISPARKGLWEGSSNLHLPLTEIQSTQMHSLIMQAVLFNYPWFYVDPQEDVDVSRIQKAERFMKYILERYVNFNKGIYFTLDDWSWDLVTEGMAILSRQWRTQQRKFITVEENEAFKNQRLDLQKLLEDTDEADFDKAAKRIIKQPFIEKSIIRTVFNGPLVMAEDPAYTLFRGDVVDSTDLNEHETVIKICYFNEVEVAEMAQSQYFDEKACELVLASTPDRKWASDTIWGNDRTRRARDIQSGVNTINPMARTRVYEFLCVYDSWRVNPAKKFSIADRIQYFIHPKTRQLMRWTYLDRISANGKLPLHMGHLFRRPRRAYGRGMVQTMFALNDAQDILINQTIDAGMLANNPSFGYRGNSTFDPQEIRMEPGLGIKMDDPNNDIRFFDWHVNPSWSMPVQNIIGQFASMLTTIGPETAGQVGDNVGPLRSTSGVNALGANATKTQNVLINRAKFPITEMFEGLYADCVEKMDKRIKITVTGADGVPMFDSDGNPITDDISKEDLKYRLHFGIYANSINMNHQMQQQAASNIAQFSFTPIALNSGCVTPHNVYAILKNLHMAYGTLRTDQFLTEPGGPQALSAEWELKMIMSGQLPPIQLNDDHEAKLQLLEPLVDSDQAQLEISQGKVAPNAIILLKKAIELHKKYAETVRAPSNVQNPFGNNQSPTMSSPTGPQATPGQTTPSPAPANQGAGKPAKGGNVNQANVEIPSGGGRGSLNNV